VIIDAFENRLCDLHTALPARIESYDSATGMADCQPLLKRKFKDGEVVDLPVCVAVPVCFPRTTTSYIHLPIKTGDVGLLVFSERSIDRYKTFGGGQDPQDPRKHNLSDGFFIPGGYPMVTPPVAVEDGAIHIKNIASDLIMKESGEITAKNFIGEFTLTPSGQIKLQGITGELVDLIDQHLDADISHTHPTAVGPSGPPINSSVYILIKALISGLKA
jgi:hypothetical protein